VKFAKIHAMEATTNTSVCLSSGQLSVCELGTSRSAALCSGMAVRTLAIPSSHNYISLGGSGASFDPRGLAISTGNVCVTADGAFTRFCIGKLQVQKAEGTGSCGNCP
jgi:hypothetical protein